MENKESIKKRIQALLQKTTDNGATEAEAIAALNKAKELMAAYFISEHDIENPYAYKTCKMIRLPRPTSAYRIEGFILPLAQLFDCIVYTHGKEMVFYGFEEDVQLCEYFYYYLIRVTLREKDLYMITLEAYELRETMSAKSIAKAFIYGFQKGINEKLEKMYADRKSMIETGTGLVLYDKTKAVQDQFETTGIRIRFVDQKSNIRTEDAFREGMTRGKNFDINQGLKEKQNAGKRYLS